MAKSEKIVFFGTPEFAVPSLEAMVESGRRPALVVTRPPRPAGRGKELREPPVAEAARRLDLELAQPESVKDEELVERLEELEPDLALVVAYGEIFPESLLELPRLGCFNVHASLLPKYRGASPIQGAIAGGEKKTGVTLMRMTEELDAGPVLVKEQIEIGPKETTGELAPRMAELAARVLADNLDALIAGGLKERKQNESTATYAPLIEKSDGKVNWALEAEDIANRLRAFTPWPGMFAIFRGREVKILRAREIDWELAPSGGVGTYLGLRQGRIAVLCGNNTILGLEHLQRAGRQAVRPSEFAHGERLRIGDRFA